LAIYIYRPVELKFNPGATPQNLIFIKIIIIKLLKPHNIYKNNLFSSFEMVLVGIILLSGMTFSGVRILLKRKKNMKQKFLDPTDHDTEAQNKNLKNSYS